MWASSLTAAAPAKAGQRPAEVAIDSGKGRLISDGGEDLGSRERAPLSRHRNKRGPIRPKTAPHFSTVQKERSHVHKARGRAPKWRPSPFPPPCSYALMLENKLISL